MWIGTRLLSPSASREELPGGLESAPAELGGADGTLLAVVPIPGTGTSLAIVGYPVSNQTTARRGTGDGQAASDSPVDPAVAAGPGLLLDHDQRRVWADGAEIALTYQEFELLAFLSAHPATVFNRAELVARVWQRDFAADSRTVDVHVSRLRHKLGPRYGKFLVTEYRVGYQFRPVAGEPAPGEPAAATTLASASPNVSPGRPGLPSSR
jgi:DNA-binding winged helix-turn-helix (wHTH) protein